MPPLIPALRPQEWVKNLLVFAGLLFSGRLDESGGARRRADHLRRLLRDLERRLPVQRPPRPRARPAPPREAPPPDRQRRGLPAATAASLAVVLALGAVGARASSSTPRSRALVALYGVITAAYSLVLKRLVIIDVMTIASLFILRVVAGAVAVGAQASEFLLVCTGHPRAVPRLHEAPPGGDAGGGRSGGARGCPGDSPRARALLAAVPRPDDRDGHRGGDHHLHHLRGRLAAGRLEDAGDGALGALRDLPLPLPDLRPPRHPLDRGDPHRGPGDDLRRRSPGSARRWRCSTCSTSARVY